MQTLNKSESGLGLCLKEFDQHSIKGALLRNDLFQIRKVFDSKCDTYFRTYLKETKKTETSGSINETFLISG